MSELSITSKAKYSYVVIHRESINTDDLELAAKMRAPSRQHCIFRSELINYSSNALGCITWKGADSEYLGCNQSMLSMNSLKSVNDVIGKGDTEVPWAVDMDVDLIKKEDKRILAGGVSLVLHKYYMNDHEIVALLKKMPIIDRSGNITGILNQSFNFIDTNVNNIIWSVAQSTVKVTDETVEKVRQFFKSEINKIALSPREELCLKYLIKGLSAKEIARAIGICHRTVEFYLAKLKEKFQCRKTSMLIVKAMEAGYTHNV